MSRNIESVDDSGRVGFIAIRHTASRARQNKVIVETMDALECAINKHGPTFMDSNHAMGAILKEYDELKHELFHGTPERARAEALDLAAVVLKTVLWIDEKREINAGESK